MTDLAHTHQVQFHDRSRVGDDFWNYRDCLDCVSRESKVRALEAVVEDYESWLDDALRALGVKTVFDIPKANA